MTSDSDETEYHSMNRDGAPAVEHIARRLIVDGLGHGDSLFTPGRGIWSMANLDELKQVFVDRPDNGSLVGL